MPEAGTRAEMTTNSGLLDGKAIVITGAARGLGRAYAEAAAEARASVVVNDLDAAEAALVAQSIVASGGRAVASGHSVVDPRQVTELMSLCCSEFGKIDGLVNNAGVYPPDVAEWEERPEAIRSMIDVNLTGTILATNAAVQHMRTASSGRVINVTSGVQMGRPGCATYAATKGAVASLTYCWALDLMTDGITVNAISPIAITRMSMRKSRPLVADDSDPAAIAPAVVYLLSDLSGGMTGQIVRMNGRDLALVKHPRIGTHVRRETWTVQDVAAAFREDAALTLEPIGSDLVPSPSVR